MIVRTRTAAYTLLFLRETGLYKPSLDTSNFKKILEQLKISVNFWIVTVHFLKAFLLLIGQNVSCDRSILARVVPATMGKSKQSKSKTN